jgi:hypothetical protein
MEQSYVYLIEAPDLNRTKIGLSKDPKSRASKLSSWATVTRINPGQRLPMWNTYRQINSLGERHHDHP